VYKWSNPIANDLILLSVVLDFTWRCPISVNFHMRVCPLFFVSCTNFFLGVSEEICRNVS